MNTDLSRKPWSNAAMNFSRAWLAVTVALMGIAFAIPCVRAQEAGGGKNLLVNGSFEKGTDGWTFDSHGNAQCTMSIDESEKHNNRPTLRMENGVGNDCHVKQKVTVEPNTHYRFEGFIRTKGAETVKRGGKDGASIAVEGGFQRTPSVFGTKSWTHVTHDFTTGGETEIELGARLGFFSTPVTGVAWFADLSMVKIGKAPPR